jgi:peptide/nickel transport system permease protein
MANQTQASSKQGSVPRIKPGENEGQRLGESLFAKALRRLRRDRLTLTAMAVMVVMLLIAVFAPLITDTVLRVDPNSTAAKPLLTVGSPGHLLGTDDLGRDHLARLLHAGRISLGIGVAGAVMTLAIGLTVGMVAGYFGGVVDDALNWLITTLDSVPLIYLLIIISALFRPSPEALVIVLAVTGWTGATRLIRGQTIALREREYIISARAVGASPWRIILTHILPNLLSVTTITLAGSIGSLILAESGLSFLNLGVQPPTATWGNMLSKAQNFFVRGPHLAILPGLLIFVTVLCCYIIGDGIRDAFDPTAIE